MANTCLFKANYYFLLIHFLVYYVRELEDVLKFTTFSFWHKEMFLLNLGSIIAVNIITGNSFHKRPKMYTFQINTNSLLARLSMNRNVFSSFKIDATFSGQDQ